MEKDSKDESEADDDDKFMVNITRDKEACPEKREMMLIRVEKGN